MPIQVGLRHSQQLRVEPHMTAHHWGAPGVEVLATPVMVGLMEQTAVYALTPLYQPGETSVGTIVHVRHLQATPVGDTVTYTAEVVEVDRRRIVFRVSAEDSRGLAGEGTHERFLVNLEQFLARVYGRAESS